MIENLTKTLERYFPRPTKKCIQDWDFIFVFEQYYKGQLEIMFSQLRCQDQIQWTIVDNPMEKQVLFLIKMSDKIVMDMAHQLKILKIKDKQSFKVKLKDVNLLIYTTDKQSNPSIYNYLCFLRARMRPKNKQIYEQEKYSAFNKYKQQKFIRDKEGKLFTPEQQLRAKYHFLLTYNERKEGKETLLNAQDINKQPFNNIMKHPGFIELVPIQKASLHRHLIFGSLKDYVGPNIQSYFDFVSFMQTWLIFPMIVGLLALLFNHIYQYDADNSPFDFIYALIIMLWSILFITRWEEIQKWTKVKQSCGRSQIWTQSQDLISKDFFQKHYSNVTGQLQYKLPLKLKILLSVVSNLLCFSMMMLTLIFISYSLNARGFIDPEHKLFYSQTFSSWARPGGIFDSNTMFGQIPNIIHVIVTNGFDQNVYRPVVKKLAKLQRHESRKGYENSIIFKYFIYEFVITFADLFYIAFVRLDIEGLRQQLLSLFFIDIVRRVIAESVVPWVKHKKQRHDSLKYLKSSSFDKNDKYQKNLMSQKQELQWGAILQVNKENYEPFDDYLEIITNMGYLVMISSCFPLAPLLILIAHQVQLFQDRYKIIHIFKRKLPECYVGMGRWKNILVFLSYISIVTNIMLFAFSSQQVVSFFPKMYESGKDLLYGNTDLVAILGGAAGVATDLLQSFLNTDNATLINTGISDIIVPQPDSFIGLPDSSLEWLQKSINEQEKLEKDRCLNSDGTSCNIEDAQQNKQKIGHAPHSPPLIVKQFKPPNKESELTFMAILFFIQHFFLLLFIFIRDVLKRRKSEAQIFQERRQYKRRIKKNLPKNILTSLHATQLIKKMVEKQIKLQNTEQTKQPQKIKGKENSNLRSTVSTNFSQQSSQMAQSGIKLNIKAD